MPGDKPGVTTTAYKEIVTGKIDIYFYYFIVQESKQFIVDLVTCYFLFYSF
jgi:hypothetical protein